MADKISGVLPLDRQVVNQKSQLDKDSFLKLLLEQLKHQDPTSPMETEKMLSQTADLAVVESQQNIAKSIDTMADRFATASEYALVSNVGKYADTGKKMFLVEGKKDYTSEIYFDANYKDASFEVKNSSGSTVYQKNLEKGKKGVHNIVWQGIDNKFNTVPNGSYYVEVSYVDENGQSRNTRPGLFKIDSVRFEKGKSPSFHVGNGYIELSDIKEIKESI